MDSFLGPVLANIFMAELEKTISSLSDKKKLWKCYGDNIIAFVKTDAIQNVLPSLNSFYVNIQFTMRIKENNQIPFMDVLSIHNLEEISATVF